MQIFAEFDSHEALIREFESNLGKARAFVFGEFDVIERQTVELVLIHPLTGEWLPLKAEVVYIAPSEAAAVGLQILDWTAERSALIQSFVRSVREEPISLVLPDSNPRERLELSRKTPHVNLGSALPLTRAEEPSLSQSGLLDETSYNQATFEQGTDDVLTVSDGEADHGADEEGMQTEDDSSDAELAPESSSSPTSSRRSVPPPKNVQERVRKLNLREREAMARGGTLTERVALERAYGAVVWDGLLANAALTGPEVARIAKNGNATLPHLALIVNNAAWLSKGEVRRALLTNPRLTPPQIERVLRALPPAELKQLPKQTAYAPKVRAVALRMLSR